MKILRRNAIIITVMLFIGVAIYLNWAYNRREAELEDGAEVLYEDESGLYYAEPVSGIAAEVNSVSDYFTNARLNRQQARDSAISTLRAAAETENASQTAVDEALSSIGLMADYAVREAAVEALVTAKGFDECLAFLTDDGIIVAVPAPAEGLGNSAVSRITDIVMEETGLHTEEIKIIAVQ